MKKKQRNYKMTTSTELDYVRVIKITVGVLVVFALVYILTALGTGEIDLNKKDSKKSTETAIQYQEIIGGEMLNRKASEYYVLLFDFEDTYADYYKSLINTYNGKDNSLPFYTVDLGKKINEDYKVPEEYKGRFVEFDTFKVDDVTLIKVKNGNFSVVADGQEKVLEFFK